jgi:hypothetical protein
MSVVGDRLVTGENGRGLSGRTGQQPFIAQRGVPLDLGYSAHAFLIITLFKILPSSEIL